MRFLGILMLLGLAAVLASAADHPQLRAFPAPQEGTTRYVIVLPEKATGEAADLKVELIPGKVIETAFANLSLLGLQIDPQPLAGWGYTYYAITGKDVRMSTMMAAPGEKKIKKFVQGKGLFLNYNSALPVVIYGPEGFEVRYRIWEAGETRDAESEGVAEEEDGENTEETSGPEEAADEAAKEKIEPEEK